MYFDCICILVNSLNNFTVLSKVPGERVFDDAGVSVHVARVDVVHSAHRGVQRAGPGKKSHVAAAVAAAALCRDLDTTKDMLLWLPLLMKEEELLKDFANSLSLSGMAYLLPSNLT